MKISIITPSFNQGKYIEECILSVINQNYQNLEFIIIDGGSTDNSVEIIHKYKQHITYWESKKDEGQSHAINKGLKIATGEIVSWLNSDDVYLPDALNTISELFTNHPEVSLIHGNSILFGKHKKEKLIKTNTKHLNERYLAYIPFPQPSSFFKKEILNTIGLIDEDLHYGMDYDLLVRIALNFKILHSDKVFSKYRLHPESKTNNGLEFAKDWSKIFSKVVRSLPNSEFAIEALKIVNLYSNEEDTYKVQKKDVNLKLTLLYFLNIQMHYYYDALELEKASKIASLIKFLDESFYKKEKVNSIFSKANYLHPSIITLLRNFTRK